MSHETTRDAREPRDTTRDETRDDAAREDGPDLIDGRPVIRRTVFPAFPEAPEGAGLVDRAKLVASWAQSTRPVRVFQRFGSKNGTILAGGLAYSAIFSTFAALWAFFSIAALVLRGSPEATDLVFTSLEGAAPGLVGEGGILDRSILDQVGTLGWSSAIALLGTIWTALGWLSGARSAIRDAFGVPVARKANFALLKLLDIGIMLGLVVAMLVSAAITVASSAALKWLLGLIGVEGSAPLLTLALRVVSIAILLVFDTAVIATLIRILTGLRIPPRTLAIGALIGAILIEAIKFAGTALLGGATSNPIAASFGVLLGVLIFFNLLCTVLLLASTWIAVTMDDLALSPRRLTASEADAEAAEVELAARRERLAADRIRLRDELEHSTRLSPDHRRLRRAYELVVREEHALYEEDKRRRLGLEEPGEGAAGADAGAAGPDAGRDEDALDPDPARSRRELLDRIEREASERRGR